MRDQVSQTDRVSFEEQLDFQNDLCPPGTVTQDERQFVLFLLCAVLVQGIALTLIWQYVSGRDACRDEVQISCKAD